MKLLPKLRTSDPSTPATYIDGAEGPLMASAAQRLLAEFRALAPEIRSRAAEIEAGRRIPPDLLEVLRRVGAFRLLKPRSQGGLELDLPDAVEVLSAAARVDGSLGWALAIAGGGELLMAYLPSETYERIHRQNPDLVLAGSVQPAGTARRVSDDWRVTGQWPFASGSDHADWLFGVAKIMDGDTPLFEPDGAPAIRGFFAPASAWRIEDTWHVVGLRGTASADIALDDYLTPRDAAIDFVNGAPRLPGPLYSSVRHMLPILHGAVSVGMAEGALDDIVALAATGRRQQRTAVSMRESEIFQSELGRISAEVRAARALLQNFTQTQWARALAGTLVSEASMVEAGQTAAWLAATCVRVADACFALGGGAAVYNTSPLQRWLRDLHAAAQHAVAHPRAYIAAGRLLLDAAAAPTAPTLGPQAEG
ncbi:MAG TPA: acyl-CoA dehydrogenase family protein [Caulobacteraceae bacterium]|jgi:alkylation response protein AidB-like acyl-CoA dehydrogenase